MICLEKEKFNAHDNRSEGDPVNTLRLPGTPKRVNFLPDSLDLLIGEWALLNCFGRPVANYREPGLPANTLFKQSTRR